MAVRLEFINIIIPITVIDSHYPGGFHAYKLKRYKYYGGAEWNDDYLYRTGAMNTIDSKTLVEFWEKWGLIPTEKLDGKTYWKDFCVCESLLGSTYQCNWLEYGPENSVFLSKTEPGKVMGREEMLECGYCFDGKYFTEYDAVCFKCFEEYCAYKVQDLENFTEIESTPSLKASSICPKCGNKNLHKNIIINPEGYWGTHERDSNIKNIFNITSPHC